MFRYSLRTLLLLTVLAASVWAWLRPWWSELPGELIWEVRMQGLEISIWSDDDNCNDELILVVERQGCETARMPIGTGGPTRLDGMSVRWSDAGTLVLCAQVTPLMSMSEEHEFLVDPNGKVEAGKSTTILSEEEMNEIGKMSESAIDLLRSENP